MVPNLARLPGGCRFNPRCSDAMSICSVRPPDLNLLENGHKARCWLHDKAGASQ